MMLTVALARPRAAVPGSSVVVGLLRVRVKVLLPPMLPALRIGTAKVATVWPAAKLMVPLVAV